MINQLEALWNQYLNQPLYPHNRWFSHNDLLKYLSENNTEEQDLIEVGKSENGNSIFKLQFGNGDTRVIAWSQMHGNEATGTLALLDLIELFNNSKDSLKPVWEELTILMILQVNPDGADQFTRRNSIQIDLNRDALSDSAIETTILKNEIERFNPDVALNLHDQRNIFSVSGTENPATISYLAPSYNASRDVNGSRLKCMRLIASMKDSVADHISGHIGRYSDEFYPTAFGEYIQQKNIPCILIESGAYWNDPNRLVARKMNVKSILKLLSTLIDNGYSMKHIEDYHSIPENDTRFYDIILRNVRLEKRNGQVLMDIALLEALTVEKNVLESRFKIEDIGDLRFKRGLVEYDLNNEVPLKSIPNLQVWADFKFPKQKLSFENGIKKVL